jgi:fatty-acyl-CoA synthase
MNIFDNDLERNPANYAALTPLTFIERAASVHPTRLAVVHGDIRLNWAQAYERARRLASALTKAGVTVGDTVAVMLPNTPPMIDAHFGVPMTGAVLNTLNTRLDAQTIAFCLEHGEAKVVIVDREFSSVMKAALAKISREIRVIDVDDRLYSGPGEHIGEVEYDAFIQQGDPHFEWTGPADEWNAIGLNYTSGTTGNPKGVVIHHRGAYLNAVSNVMVWSMPRHPVYLWTLPMFHCNGWCFPWSVAAQAGVNVCLRKVEAKAIWDAIREYSVTHYCGAPIVHSMVFNAPAEMRAGVSHKVSAMVAGAAPPAAMIEGLDAIGFDLIHVYGLTEVYGPTVVCEKQAQWESLNVSERARLNARQGVRYPLQEAVAVRDPATMRQVPADGETIGEIMYRGNITMKGYLKNKKATAEAFAGGWFHTGDLGVVHPDGYIKIKDRSKDIIISGGENISSIEVEDVLYSHPAVLAAAVVAMPNDKWGETPCAFIEVKPGAAVTADEIISHCKQYLAGFKVPRAVVFDALPKTSTGKIQKFELRQRANSVAAIDV